MAFTKPAKWPGFTSEGYRIYETAVAQIRTALANGYTYDQACDALHGIDPGLKAFISDDFLQIIIAEEHFGCGAEIDDLALTLGLPYERLEKAINILLDEMANAASRSFQYSHAVSTLTH